MRSLNTYRLLFECLPQPAVLLDTRGFIEAANAQAIEFLGLPSAMALIRRSIIQFFDAESRTRLYPLLRPSPDTGALPPVRVRIRTGGDEIPCAVHVIHLPGEDTATTRILLVIADLRAELALRESEQNQRKVLEYSPIPMASYRLNERREVLFVNREFTRTFGYSLEEVATVEQWEALAFPDPAYRQQSFAWWHGAVAQACQEQGVVPAHEFRILCKDGGLRDVEISAALADDCVIVSFVDVTHRNEIEQRLRLSEERHRQWAHNSADVVWTMNLEGQITYMSPAVMMTQGRTPEEAMATPWEEMFTPDSLAVVQQGFGRALADVAAGQLVQFHERLEECRKDGGTTWTDVKATSLYDEEGRFVSIMGISRDITEQKRIEDELRATRDRLEAILNALPDLIFRVDRQGRIHDRHIPAGDPLLSPPDEIVGRTLAEILPESASRVILEALGEAAEQGHHQGGVYALSTPEGMVWHELSIAAMGDRTTAAAEFILLIRDITQRMQQEEALRLSEERHRILAENTRDVIWAMQLDGRISYVSPAVEQVRGVTPEEAMRQPIEEILTPAAQAEVASYFGKLIAAVQAGERPPSYRGEQEYYRKDGGTFWAEVTAIPVLREDGRFVELLGVSRDIDERKRHAHELQLARDAANDANQAKSRFLAHMSHEIRTPMNGVLGMAQILAREGLTPDQRQMIDSILAAGRSLLSIINDILDLSKIEAGQLQLEPRPFDLNRTLAHVVSIGGVNARAKGIDLRLAVDPAIAGGWLGDALRLEQVLFNLAGNAIKFTEKGEVVIHVRPLELDASHGRLRFEIEDSGIGMDAEAVARLFTPFSQADASITRRFGGTGLGLSISKRLVELMGGEIGVRSTPGVGSVFWFDWPASRVAAPEPEPKASGERGSKPPGWVDLKGLRVLVVDDSAINRSVAQRALKLAGVAVTLANDGEQALNRLREQPDGYDVVLMDIQMPVMDGLTAARAIRADPALASLPVLALSAGVLEEERESVLAAGMNDFITKPLDLQQLNAALARFLPGG
ncbi:MAG: PAS domain S-box protein [Methylococcus sp.]